MTSSREWKAGMGKTRVGKAGVAAMALMAALVLGTGEAGAGILLLDSMGAGGSVSQGQPNDLLEDIYGTGVTARQGYYGSTIRLAEKATLTFTFLGFEAGYDNEFLLDADGNGRFDLIFSNKGGGAVDINGKARTAIGDTYIVALDPKNFGGGIIPFLFKANVGGKKGSVANGSANDGPVDFFTSYDEDPLAVAGPSLVLLFDDGGAGVDSDYDDMGVRIAAAVSEPATVALLGGGLLALGWIGRRRKEARAPLEP